MKLKKFIAVMTAATMIMSMPVSAAWIQDSVGWWWRNDDGSWPASRWEWLDGNGDGIAECYYFGADGYMYAGTTTPDGYTVDANGAWTVNGAVQARSSSTGAVSVPDWDAAVTAENVMSLLTAYDPDGAFIMQSCINDGENVLVWWDSGQNLVEGMNTAVHEELHGYTFNKGGWNSEAIYVGNGNHILVNYTDVFPSSYMATTIPESLRTFRWATYVGQPTQNLASDVEGPYGLLNEWAAYCWGTNTSVKLYDYYAAQPFSSDIWLDYVSDAAGTMYAYAEFRYYILQYMLYAYQNYPNVYNAVMANQSFLSAFSAIESKYASVVSEFFNNLNRVEQLAEANGAYARIEGDTFWVYDRTGSGSGVGMFLEDYNSLMTEMQKTEYQQILSLLMQ